MTIFPHDHHMWAVIGIYGGQEDNTFFRHSSQGLDRAGFKALDVKDSVGLGPEAIHAVHNPRSVLTGALHVYGGDFFSESRSEWDPEILEEEALRHGACDARVCRGQRRMAGPARELIAAAVAADAVCAPGHVIAG